MLIFEDIYEVG